MALNLWKGPIPQIDQDGRTINLDNIDPSVEVNQGQIIHVHIFADERTYSIDISADTLLRIIAKRNNMLGDGSVQVGEGGNLRGDAPTEIILATEDELLGR